MANKLQVQIQETVEELEHQLEGHATAVAVPAQERIKMTVFSDSDPPTLAPTSNIIRCCRSVLHEGI